MSFVDAMSRMRTSERGREPNSTSPSSMCQSTPCLFNSISVSFFYFICSSWFRFFFSLIAAKLCQNRRKNSNEGTEQKYTNRLTAIELKRAIHHIYNAYHIAAYVHRYLLVLHIMSEYTRQINANFITSEPHVLCKCSLFWCLSPVQT